MGSADNTAGELLELIRRYEYQLLTGCQNADCTEVLCLTGRANISDRPIRKYTARSARAIAMSVCSGQKPRAHLCRHCDPSVAVATNHIREQRRDPSSLIQLLSDTEAFQPENVSRTKHDLALAEKHQLLDRLLAPNTGDPLSDSGPFDALAPCLDWLLDTLPEQRIAVWEMIDRDVISVGSEVPTRAERRPRDENWNNWVAALDAVNSQSHLQLLERTLLVVGRAMNDERAQLIERPRTCFRGCRSDRFDSYGIIMKLVVHIRHRGTTQPHIMLATLVWLKRLFAKTWNGNTVVVRGSVAHVILEIIRCFRVDTFPRKNGSPFAMPFVTLRLTDLDLASSWQSSALDNATKHILHFRRIFLPGQVTLCFQIVNLLSMSQANGNATKIVHHRERHSIGANRDLDPEQLSPQLQQREEHYMLLYVSRVDLLKDTFDQLWQRRPSELRRPLRVRMGADQLDIGHDLGGVQIEFFNTVCRHIFSAEAQMFTTNSHTGFSYFTAGSLQPLHMFELFGLLLALAIYNGIALPIRMPIVLYFLICNHEFPLSEAMMIKDAWPEFSKSLLSMVSEYVPDLEYTFPLEANGARLECLGLKIGRGRQPDGRLELPVSTVSITSGVSTTISDVTEIEHAWPGWKLVMSAEEPKPVNPGIANVRDYIRVYSEWLFRDSVRPQLEAFLRGFQSSELLDQHTLSLLGPHHLREYVEGTDVLNIQELRAATRYDGYIATQKYITSFWRVVTSWSQEKQKLLLKFVTAAERIPISGARQLTFIIKKAQPVSLDALPSSSTCFGTLMLPKYPSTQIMEEKLSLALKYGSEGFGNG